MHRRLQEIHSGLIREETSLNTIHQHRSESTGYRLTDSECFLKDPPKYRRNY